MSKRHQWLTFSVKIQCNFNECSQFFPSNLIKQEKRKIHCRKLEKYEGLCSNVLTLFKVNHSKYFDAYTFSRFMCKYKYNMNILKCKIRIKYYLQFCIIL